MIRNILSRYRPRYVRSLVYMLQASEYDVREYLRWYHRTGDFSGVEKRKKLDRTPKALALTALSWICVAIVVAVAVAGLIWGGPAVRIAALVLLIGLPFVLPYMLALAALLLRAAQYPIERRMISHTARTLAAHPGYKIAIAGSFGKTSMREILKTVLSEGKTTAAPGGSQNTPIGIARFAAGLRGDEEVLIFELGEYYPGDVRKLCEIVRPELGIITGVNEAHLEKFVTLDRTLETVFELADFLREKPIYINAESVPAKERAKSSHFLYSREGAGDWRVENPRTDLSGTSFTLVRGNERIEAHSKLLGLHQVGPLAAAADIASRLGLTPSQIKMGIMKTVPFEHRLEPKTDAQGVTTLDDSYNGNPDGVRAVIEFLGSLRGRRRWYVTPGLVEMGDRTEAVHREIGRQLAIASIERVVLIKNSVTPYIEQGLRASNYSGDVIWYGDALAAFAALPHMTVSGDVVLLQNDWPDQYA